MMRVFLQNEFELVESLSEGSYFYLANLGHWARLGTYHLYRLLAYASYSSGMNRELVQKNWLQICRRRS
jgi:hypothetical protein